ncbi:MAG: 4Fe-4S binding protein [Syntrophaceticus sp.]|nr:4Fe-4S binding protein [Syntrophomonadaceae bacterium]
MPPKVDLDKCDGCETCVDVCPEEVFELEDDKAKVARPDDCSDCETCVDECPNEAITMDE